MGETFEDEMWYGKKRYHNPRRAKPAPSAPSFTERKAGDDPVQDVIDAAMILRSAHPTSKHVRVPDIVGLPAEGDQRIFWGLMLEAVRVAAGLSLDDLIERIRAQAKSIPREQGSQE